MFAAITGDNIVYLIVFGVIALGGLYFGLLEPILSGDSRAEKRKKALQGSARRRDRAALDANARRKQIADSLKELERKGSRKLTIEQKLRQAGLSASRVQYFLYSGVASLLLGFFALVLTGNLIFAGLLMIVGGLGLPNWILSFLRKRRINKFNQAFPDAVDVIVRGIKAGLPLGDCLRVISNEAPEPVRSEFRSVVEAQALGLQPSEAVERIPENVPTPEANFFAIVIAIQQKSGGNLSEALSGLSKVLRERRKLKQKIKAVSSEATASAAIVGALPVVVATLVYITSPHYIELLWTTSTGRFWLAISGGVMFMGVMVMRKMINFDI